MKEQQGAEQAYRRLATLDQAQLTLPPKRLQQISVQAGGLHSVADKDMWNLRHCVTCSQSNRQKIHKTRLVTVLLYHCNKAVPCSA